MRLKLFGVAVFLLSSTLLARADDLYTVSFSVEGDSGTYTFVEPSILTSPFTVNASDLTSSVESGDVLASIFLNPTDSSSSGVDCFSSTNGACGELFFSPPGGSGLVSLGGFFGPSLTSPGSYESTSRALSVSIEPTAATPEPSSLALLGTGVLGFAGVLRKRFA